jgi:hypothetical protein
LADLGQEFAILAIDLVQLSLFIQDAIVYATKSTEKKNDLF